VSNFGGALGRFGAHSLAPQAINDAIFRADPFPHLEAILAINLWVSMEDEGCPDHRIEAAFNRSLALLRHHLAALGSAAARLIHPTCRCALKIQARVAFWDAHVPVFSFIYGIPPRENP